MERSLLIKLSAKSSLVIICGSRRVADVRLLLKKAVKLQVILQAFVASERHQVHLLLRPGIVLNTFDKGDLRTKTAMNPCTLVANEDAVVDAGPVRIRCCTIEALLVLSTIRLNLLQDLREAIVNTIDIHLS